MPERQCCFQIFSPLRLDSRRQSLLRADPLFVTHRGCIEYHYCHNAGSLVMIYCDALRQKKALKSVGKNA